MLVGDWAARDVAEKQPTKLAAIEGLYQTTRGAPEHILGWYTDDQVKYGIEIPHLLSLLSYHSWNAKVQGLDAVPASQRPPVNVVRFAFQTMVGIGTLLALLGVALSGRVDPAKIAARVAPGSTAPWCSPARCRWSR